jgi:lysophospholipase L1-like esterase
MHVFGWPGTGFDLRFEGDRLDVDFSGSRAWIQATWDDGESFAMDLGTSPLVGFPVPGPGPRVLRVRKRTEAMVGDLVVGAVLPGSGRILPPPPAPSLGIEFYGDSITCGYGCLDPVPEHGFQASTESFPLSWSGLTGALLGAEVHAQAISGIGVFRNWPGVEGNPMPSRWKLAHPDRDRDWDLSSWIPHAVVVNLGSNDFGTLPFPSRTEFVQAFDGWLGEVRRARPGIPLVVVDGPLLASDHPAAGTRSLVRSLLDDVAARTGSQRFSLSPCDPADGFAADFHPSAAQHRRNAQEFAPYLARLLERGAPGS